MFHIADYLKPGASSITNPSCTGSQPSVPWVVGTVGQVTRNLRIWNGSDVIGHTKGVCDTFYKIAKVDLV